MDDHAVFRDGLASLLLAWGREVVGRPGEDEQSMGRVEAGSPDEILMDMRMPGRETSRAAAVGGQPVEVAIVVLTVSKEEAELFGAIKAGAQGHLPPELEAPRLRSMLEGAARGEAPSAARTRHARVTAGFLAAPLGEESDLRRLTKRELEVLGLVTEGLRNRQIAAAMGISENTVKFHLKNLAEKFHASNRAELAARAVRGGMVPDSDRSPGGRSSTARRHAR